MVIVRYLAEKTSFVRPLHGCPFDNNFDFGGNFEGEGCGAAVNRPALFAAHQVTVIVIAPMAKLIVSPSLTVAVVMPS